MLVFQKSHHYCVANKQKDRNLIVQEARIALENEQLSVRRGTSGKDPKAGYHTAAMNDLCSTAAQRSPLATLFLALLEAYSTYPRILKLVMRSLLDLCCVQLQCLQSFRMAMWESTFDVGNPKMETLMLAIWNRDVIDLTWLQDFKADLGSGSAFSWILASANGALQSMACSAFRLSVPFRLIEKETSVSLKGDNSVLSFSINNGYSLLLVIAIIFSVTQHLILRHLTSPIAV